MSDPCVCVICSTQFVRVKNTTGLYCSRRCAWLARGGASFNARIARESAGKRGDAQRGRGQGRAYRKRDGRHEHRGIVEKAIGRRLASHEVVHHVDGNHLNNDPGNLVVLSRAEHLREHGLAIPGKPLTHRPWEQRWNRGL